MKHKIIVIIGATATGKTGLAIKLANTFSGEIVNADAFQIYKEIAIGTARASEEERKQATFHLDGELSIYDEWNIKVFQTKAFEIIDDIIARNKMPIIVGGSFLYVEALVKNYNLSNTNIRNDKYNDLSVEELFEKANKINPIAANKIINNKKRLVRMLQLFDNSEFELNAQNEPKYEPIYVYTYMDREKIYERINLRCDIMIKQGWVNEVKDILDKDINVGALNSMKAIGYQEIINHLLNNTPLNIDKIKQDTRHYAKRQLTWINNRLFNNIKYEGNYGELIAKIKTLI